MRAFPVRLPSGVRYWTVLDEDLAVVDEADAFLRHVRFGRDGSELTTRSYTGGIALFLRWCARTGRHWHDGVPALGLFITWLRHAGPQVRHSALGYLTPVEFERPSRTAYSVTRRMKTGVHIQGEPQHRRWDWRAVPADTYSCHNPRALRRSMRTEGPLARLESHHEPTAPDLFTRSIALQADDRRGRSEPLPQRFRRPPRRGNRRHPRAGSRFPAHSQSNTRLARLLL